jgi:hypothetical protein
MHVHGDAKTRDESGARGFGNAGSITRCVQYRGDAQQFNLPFAGNRLRITGRARFLNIDPTRIRRL